MKTILIADDEEDLRLLIRTTLQGADFRLLEAGDGERALEMARREPPDLIVLDWCTGWNIRPSTARWSDPGKACRPTSANSSSRTSAVS